MSSYAHLPPYSVAFPAMAFSQEDGVDWGVAAYGIPELWKQYRGDGVTVAVIDSGIAKHPALEVKEWRNFSADASELDSLGHGTHVAGVIAAKRGPCRGIAPGVSLISCKALGHSGTGSNAAVAEAVEFATEAKADIIGMSLGSESPDPRLHAAIKAASAAGVIVVCAAGNDGGAVNYPAAFAETIAVGAVDRHGNACPFSCRGKEIAIAAPGQDITSTWLDGSYATLTGTSMAAPFVVGTLALYVSALKKKGEPVSHQSVMKALSQTASDAGDKGRDDLYGWGLVNPSALLTYAPMSGVTIFIPGARVV
jgi:subtilisin